VSSLRLLSVNTRTIEVDRAGLGRLVAAQRPHLVCVHGSPTGPRWRSASSALARACGLVVVSGGRLGGGNLIMSTLAVDSRQTRDLRFGGRRAWLAPGATLAALRFDGADFLMVAGRLVGNAAERLEQTGELQAAVAGLVPGDPPVVLSVDGADRPGTSSWEALTGNRVAVGGGVFVDGRIDIDSAEELERGGVRLFPPVLLELTLPG
jgi:hypothetical protein